MKKVFKTFVFLFFVLFFSVGLTACGLDVNINNNNNNNNNTNQVTPQISFDRVEVQLEVGDSYTLNPTISGLSGSDLVTFSMNKEGIVTISGNTVTARTVGEVEVTATLKGYSISAKLTIKVNPKGSHGGETRVKASIPEAQQGVYVQEGIRVTVFSDHVIVGTAEGNMEFDIYQDADGMYVVDEQGALEVKIYVTFNGNNLNVQEKGTFTKTTSDKVATMPKSLQNVYNDGLVRVEVKESSLSVTIPTAGYSTEYVIYEDSQGYYFYDVEKTYFTVSATELVLQTQNHQTYRIGELVLTTDERAKLTEAQQGLYSASSLEIELKESTLSMQGATLYLYKDAAGKIYFFSYDDNGNESKVYLTFGSDSVIIEGTTFKKAGSTTPVDPDEAEIPEDYRGLYYGDGMVVEVYVSSVLVRDAEGKGHVYNLYVDAAGIYFLEGTEKVYCAFTSNSVVNKYGVFTRNGGTQPQDGQVASIPKELQNQYTNGTVNVEISESRMKITSPLTTGEIEYTIYENNNGYYFEDEGYKTYFTLTSAGLVIDGETFTVGSAQPVTDTKAVISAERQGKYSYNGYSMTIDESSLTYFGMSFNLYQDENGVYMYTTGEDNELEKIYIVFGENSITIEGTTLIKGGASLNDTKAKVDSKYQGEYSSNGVKVQVSESEIVYSGGLLTYDLYEDEDGIYFYIIDEEDGEAYRSYITFEEGYIKINGFIIEKVVAGQENSKYYTVSWKNYDGSYLDYEQYKEGLMPTYTSETPYRESDDQYDYVFSGWTPEVVKVTENAVYTATFKAVEKSGSGTGGHGSSENPGENELPVDNPFYEVRLVLDSVESEDAQVSAMVQELYQGAFVQIFGTYVFEMARIEDSSIDYILGDFEYDEDSNTITLVAKKEFDSKNEHYYYFYGNDVLVFRLTYRDGKYYMPMEQELGDNVVRFTLVLDNSGEGAQASDIPSDPLGMYNDFNPAYCLTQDQWEEYFFEHGLLYKNFAVEYEGPYSGKIVVEVDGALIHVINQAEDIYYERTQEIEGGYNYNIYHVGSNGQWEMQTLGMQYDRFDQDFGIIPIPFLKMGFNSSEPKSYYVQRFTIKDEFGYSSEYQKFRVYAQNGMLSKISYVYLGETYEYNYSRVGEISLTLPEVGSSSGSGNQGGEPTADLSEYYKNIVGKVFVVNKFTELEDNVKEVIEEVYANAKVSVFEDKSVEIHLDKQAKRGYDDDYNTVYSAVPYEMVIYGSLELREVDSRGYVKGSIKLESVTAQGVNVPSDGSILIRWYISDELLRLQMDDLFEYYIYLEASTETLTHIDKPEALNAWPKQKVQQLLEELEAENLVLPQIDGAYSYVVEEKDGELKIICVFDVDDDIYDFIYDFTDSLDLLLGNYKWEYGDDFYYQDYYNDKVCVRVEYSNQVAFVTIFKTPYDDAESGNGGSGFVDGEYPIEEITEFLNNNEIDTTVPEFKVEGAKYYGTSMDIVCVIVVGNVEDLDEVAEYFIGLLTELSYEPKTITVDGESATYYISEDGKLGVLVQVQDDYVSVQLIDAKLLSLYDGGEAYPEEEIASFLEKEEITEEVPDFNYEGATFSCLEMEDYHMLIIYVLVEEVDDAYDYIVGQLADFTLVEDDDSISDDYYISSEQQIMIMLNKTDEGVAIAIYSAEKFE